MTKTGDRSPSAPRDSMRTSAGDAPPRRSGRRCGYPGRDQLDLTLTLLRAALSELARDEDPEARRAGARLAEEVTETLDRLRDTAERASTRSRRIQAAAIKHGERLDRVRTQIRSRHTQPKPKE